MNGGALTGIRVVDLTTVVVGPTATLYLADYGADVIKIESPGGDLLRTLGGASASGELSGKFMHFNRNKRSIVLDLKQEQGLAALHRLLDTADVFIANVRPAALKRLSLGGEDLRQRYSRLIVCNLMGFGQDGRYRDRPAYDTIIQGMTGVGKFQLGFPFCGISECAAVGAPALVLDGDLDLDALSAGNGRGIHNLAVDSKGNIYLGESFGQRVLRWSYKGT